MLAYSLDQFDILRCFWLAQSGIWR